MKYIKAHFFVITLILLFVFAATASFFRFMILKDYDVTYEAECSPYSEQCFIYCEDDDCEEVFYYKYITRHAEDLFRMCGGDITDCDAASYCDSGQVSCHIDWCNAEVDECENLDMTDYNFDIDEVVNDNEDL